MAAVKPEIKVDPDENKPLMDIDEFEEDTDLQIPNEKGQTWLIKVSEDLWKAWAKIYQEAPGDTDRIEIGKLRVFNPKPGQDPNKQEIQIRLNDTLEEHQPLPKTYNLDIKSNGYNNTVVFSEKDQPGQSKGYGSGQNRHLAPGAKPTGINKFDRYNNSQPRKPGSYRSAIPRQTALAPPIHHEAVANPVEDDSTLQYFTQNYQKALIGSTKTRFNDSTKLRHPGMDNDSFNIGSLTSKPGKGKKKVPKEKAVRMEKDRLLDALKNCFKEYQYWSLRALRQRLQQPEAYIKETLDDIAVLMRSGDFVQNYKLKPEYERMVREDLGNVAEVKEELAPVKMEETDDGTGDEMDSGEEFEDVDMKLEG
ncbi:Transcription initiation factor IIF subunit beta [Pseudocercospora fuligena]|uniref:Transcription initiation factor IIF subunit beta n=1 Tax=Pseudocercospora fuligena TaxID=685502 RepID=A0A8H6RAA6_9PEZI|nr:Transcription initiation factor IIF subunit beta [Pseudocercospora fuligena]